jgi:hypothetical protein
MSLMVGVLASMLTLPGCERDTRTTTGPEIPAVLDQAKSRQGDVSLSHSYSGEATASRALVPALGVRVTLSQAGPLAPSGGADEATLLSAEVPGVLTAQVLHAATVAQGDESRSEASAADVVVTVGGHTITAEFLIARAAARCERGATRLSASSDITRLTVDGTAIAVRSRPNQSVPLPGGGEVIINEQASTSDAITVNALHIVIPGVADVVVASAHADIQCAKDCPPPHGDFVTGGGWITVNGAKATFGVAGGIKSNGLWGHLAYIDHDSRLKVKGTGVTGYEVVDATTRRITGTAEIDGELGTYEVIVSDRGEPGREDTFEIALSTGYRATGTLDGGNIQLHAKPAECQ